MSDPLDNIEDHLDDGGIPQRVTNRALFRALQAIWTRLGYNAGTLDDFADWRIDMERRVSYLEEQQKINPSIFAYIKSNPRAAVGWIIGLLAFMTLALGFSEPLRLLVGSLLP
jgi:hypothetical protein